MTWGGRKSAAKPYGGPRSTAPNIVWFPSFIILWNTPAKRYTVSIALLSFAYVAALVVAVKVLEPPGHGQAHTPQWAQYAIALAPAVPVLGMIWAMAHFLLQMKDEYQRVRLTIAILWSTGLTLSICTVWGFLQTFGKAPAAPLYMVFVLFMAIFGLLQCIGKLRDLLSRLGR